MKNIIIITGEADSGKSFLARTLALVKINPVILDGRGWLRNLDNPFRFVNIKKTTECLIVDDLSSADLEAAVDTFSKSIEVHIPASSSFNILIPTVILVLVSQIGEITSDSIKQKCHIINCSRGAIIEGPNRLFLQEKIN